MAGIYIHIPYCKSICPYCDFHKTILGSDKDKMLQAMKNEIEQRKDYISEQSVESIYIGGGTPSVLEPQDIKNLLDHVYSCHDVLDQAEVTIELNPDDVTMDYLDRLKFTNINRLSIGFQSFSETDLKFLHRRHTVTQAERTVKWAQKTGFTNISIDLMYGLQNQTVKSWENTLLKAFDLDIQHISAYHLTIEEGTLFHKWLKTGKINNIKEEHSVEQFEVLMDMAGNNNFIHYEISNFAREGWLSVHNSNYWKQRPYIGIGPSAHSYNGTTRQWNIRDNKAYVLRIFNKKPAYESEYLDMQTRYNEYVVTSLRTMWGIDLEFLESEFSKELLDYCLNLAKKFQEYGLLKQDNNHLKLTDQGKLVSDNIITDLLFVTAAGAR